MATITNYDEKTKSILNKILVAARDSSFGYYEDFTIKGYDVDASNFSAILSIVFYYFIYLSSTDLFSDL